MAFLGALGTMVAVQPSPQLAATSAAPAQFAVGTSVVDINPTVTTYSGGFGASPPIAPGTVVGDPLSVRALYVSNGHHAVELVSVDSQAEFAAYQEGPDYGISYARAQAASAIDAGGTGPAMAPSDIIVQATHGHATPTLEGLWGPVPVAYLTQVTQAEITAMVTAAQHPVPAELEIGSADASALDDTTLAQYDAFPGWAVDPQLSVLRAVDPGSGATIATYVTVPAHPDIVCGQCLGQESADYPGVVRTAVQDQLGGVAIVGPGTLGREETPVQATGIADMELLATQVTTIVDEALVDARLLTDDTVAATEQFARIPATNPLLIALAEGYALPPAQRQTVEDVTGEYPIDRADTTPWATGTLVGSPLTAVRLGDVAFVSMPGEPFPEVRAAIAKATGATMVVAMSKGQDDLGYFYPSWVAPFAAAVYPSDQFLDSVGPAAGDLVITGQLQNLHALGFTTGAPLAEPLPVDVAQTTAPGLQVVGGPFVGDATTGGGLSVTMLAVYSAPDLPEGTLDYGPPAGSAPVALGTKGPVQWDFGDGTTGTSGYHEFAGTDLQPTEITHVFGVGVHRVTASVTSATGRVATRTFTVVVGPQFQAVVAASPGGTPGEVTYRAATTGGDGTVLAYRWVFSDGTTAAGAEVTHDFGTTAPGAVLTVTDGSGTTATAQG
ncbi:MAG TPA: PKD domain-containing protein [Acidimicrobiales bacterium]|nr:PKD domain-containing protein [Acidimicrobiales bacterium]